MEMDSRPVSAWRRQEIPAWGEDLRPVSRMSLDYITSSAGSSTLLLISLFVCFAVCLTLEKRHELSFFFFVGQGINSS